MKATNITKYMMVIVAIFITAYSTAPVGSPVEISALSGSDDIQDATPDIRDIDITQAANAWLERNPRVTVNELARLYGYDTENKDVYSREALEAIHKQLQELRQPFIFFGNASDKPIMIKVGIDQDAKLALLTVDSSEELPTEPGATMKQASLTIPAHECYRLVWEPQFGTTAFVSTRTNARHAVQPNRVFAITPGSYINVGTDGLIDSINNIE